MISLYILPDQRRVNLLVLLKLTKCFAVNQVESSIRYSATELEISKHAKNHFLN